jgi:hypothetical protein
MDLLGRGCIPNLLLFVCEGERGKKRVSGQDGDG